MPAGFLLPISSLNSTSATTEAAKALLLRPSPERVPWWLLVPAPCLFNYYSRALGVCTGVGLLSALLEVLLLWEGRWALDVGATRSPAPPSWHQHGCCQALWFLAVLLKFLPKFASLYLEKIIYADERTLKSLMIFVPEMMR